MAINDQLHIRIEPAKQREFKSWCARHGISMSEVCRLCIDAVLDGRLTIEDIKETDE